MRNIVASGIGGRPCLSSVVRLDQRLQRDHGTTVSISARKTALRVCFPAFGKNPLSARLSCFIGFLQFVGTMTMALFSQIRPYDGHLCRVSLITPKLETTTKINILNTPVNHHILIEIVSCIFVI